MNSAPDPLFGDKPVQSSLSQVETVCVHGYPKSATRPPMWEGFQIAHSKIVEAQTPGEVWVSGEFVIDEEDPRFTQVHLRIPPGAQLTDEVSEVFSWMNKNESTEHLACDLTAIAEVPANHPTAHLIREYADVIYDSFTGHGEFGRKGFPILPLFPSP